MATIRTKAADVRLDVLHDGGAAGPHGGAVRGIRHRSPSRSGSTGNAVRDLQLELNRRGFNVGHGGRRLRPDDDHRRDGASRRPRSSRSPARSRRTTGRRSRGWPTPRPDAPAHRSRAVPGFTADGRGDVLGRIATGDLYYYPGGVGTHREPGAGRERLERLRHRPLPRRLQRRRPRRPGRAQEHGLSLSLRGQRQGRAEHHREDHRQWLGRLHRHHRPRRLERRREARPAGAQGQRRPLALRGQRYWRLRSVGPAGRYRLEPLHPADHPG